MEVKITSFGANNSKQIALEQNNEFITNFKKTVDKQLKEKLKEFTNVADNLTEKDIQIIMEISSETVSCYFKEYVKLLARHGSTFRN